MNDVTTKWWYYILPPAVLSLITTLFYYPSLRYPFVFDDLPTIMNNYEIRSTSAEKLLFSSTRWISRLINYFTFSSWNLDPFYYRLIDLGIHLLAGILIFSFVLLICKNVVQKPFFQKHALLLATVTSSLFLLHPAQTQTATYITQIRLEGLVAIFSFAILILFALSSYTKQSTIKYLYYGACALLMLFAAGTKEIIVVLPLLLLLVDWFFLAEGNYKTFISRLPIHGILALILYVTYFKLGAPLSAKDAFSLNVKLPSNRGNLLTADPQQLITPFQYLFGQFRVILHYIKIFFIPTGLSFDYGWKLPNGFFSVTSFVPFLLLMSLLGSGLYLFIKNKINFISFAIAWFFTVILPRSSIIPSTELTCDYKTYLASFAPFFLIAIGVAYLSEKLPSFIARLSFLPKYIAKQHVAELSLAFIFCFALGLSSLERNKVWNSSLDFWGDVIAKTDGHVPARAYNNYAVALVELNQQDHAAIYYKKAIETDPTYAEPVINLALYYQINKDYNQAFALYQRAITMKEVHPEMYNNLGLLHLSQNNIDKAIVSFQMAIQLRPYYSRALLNLGRTYENQNKIEAAIDCYEKAANGDQKTLEIIYCYGKSCYLTGKLDKAIAALEHVESQCKNYEKTRYMLGIAYYSTNQPQKAVPYFVHTYSDNPSDNSACYNLAQSLLQIKEYEKALPLFMQCKNDKQFPHSMLHIAKCLHYTGRTDDAKRELAHFIKSTPARTLKQMGGELMKEITTT